MRASRLQGNPPWLNRGSTQIGVYNVHTAGVVVMKMWWCRRRHQKWWCCVHLVAMIRRQTLSCLEMVLRSHSRAWLSAIVAWVSLLMPCSISHAVWRRSVSTTLNTLSSFHSASFPVSKAHSLLPFKLPPYGTLKPPFICIIRSTRRSRPNKVGL